MAGHVGVPGARVAVAVGMYEGDGAREGVVLRDEVGQVGEGFAAFLGDVEGAGGRGVDVDVGGPAGGEWFVSSEAQTRWRRQTYSGSSDTQDVSSLGSAPITTAFSGGVSVLPERTSAACSPFMAGASALSGRLFARRTSGVGLEAALDDSRRERSR